MKLAERLQLGPAQVRAEIQPESYDPEKRTIEVCWSTGSEVARRGCRESRGEPFLESLSLDPAHVRLGRLKRGASVLNQHSSWDLGDVLGVVEDAWIAAGRGFARLRLSARESIAGLVQDIRDGIIRHVSVGYVVHRMDDVTPEGTTPLRLMAVDWEPFEVSFVAVPADPDAGTRAQDRAHPLTPCDVYRREADMTQPTFGAGVETETRAATPPAPAPAPAQAPSAPTPVDPVALRAEGARAERQRVHEIIEHCQAIRIAPETVRELVASGEDLARLIPRITAAYVAQHEAADPGATRSRTTVGVEERTLKRTAIEGALFHRLNPTIEPPAELGELRGRSVLDMMRFLEAAKHGADAAMRLGRDELIKRGLHTTSDFPLLLEQAGRRTLRKAYELVETKWRLWCSEGTLVDFRPTDRIQVGSTQGLSRLPEGADIKFGTLGESKETIKLATYAEGIAFSRQAIINDDLNGFSRLTRAHAEDVALLVEDLAYEQLLNGTVGGASLYSTSSPDRANYTSGTSTALVSTTAGIDAIGALAALMQLQTNDAGKRLNLEPKFLHVPVAKQAIAAKLTADITPTKADDVNIWRGRLTVIPNSRLDATSPVAYFLSADPNRVDTVEVAWLDGNIGPQFSMKECFENMGIKYAVAADVSAKALDYRGFAKSKGAA